MHSALPMHMIIQVMSGNRSNRHKETNNLFAPGEFETRTQPQTVLSKSAASKNNMQLYHATAVLCPAPRTNNIITQTFVILTMGKLPAVRYWFITCRIQNPDIPRERRGKAGGRRGGLGRGGAVQGGARRDGAGRSCAPRARPRVYDFHGAEDNRPGRPFRSTNTLNPCNGIAEHDGRLTSAG